MLLWTGPLATHNLSSIWLLRGPCAKEINWSYSYSHHIPVSQASSEEFIPIFANNPRELRAFLEHMITVEPDSPQGVYDTLLELRLQDWAHEQDPEVNTIHHWSTDLIFTWLQNSEDTLLLYNDVNHFK